MYIASVLKTCLDSSTDVTIQPVGRNNNFKIQYRSTRVEILIEALSGVWYAKQTHNAAGEKTTSPMRETFSTEEQLSDIISRCK